MSFTERVMAAGEWNVTLRDSTPRSIMRLIQVEQRAFSAMVVLPAAIDPATITDAAMLQRARFVGVYRGQSGLGYELRGASLATLVGDEDNKGDVFESPFNPTANGWLSQWYDALTPTWWALNKGTLVSPGGSWFPNNKDQGLFMMSRKDTWKLLCDHFGVEWRIRPTFHFDVAKKEVIYGTVPRTLILGPTAGVSPGREMSAAGLLGINGIGARPNLEVDMEDYSTKVIMEAGTQDEPEYYTKKNVDRFLAPNGTPMVLDRVISGEQAYSSKATNQAERDARQNTANQQAGRFDQPYRQWKVDGSTYDIGRDVQVGSPVWLYDPINGLYDMSQPPVYFRGSQLNPSLSRIVGLTTPIRQGLGVYLRLLPIGSSTPQWVNLTPYVEWETGNQTIDLGDTPRTSR